MSLALKKWSGRKCRSNAGLWLVRDNPSLLALRHGRAWRIVAIRSCREDQGFIASRSMLRESRLYHQRFHTRREALQALKMVIDLYATA